MQCNNFGLAFSTKLSNNFEHSCFQDNQIGKKFTLKGYCLWKEILSQHRIRHKDLTEYIYFTYRVGIITSYSNRIKSFFKGYNRKINCSAMLFQHESNVTKQLRQFSNLLKCDFMSYSATVCTCTVKRSSKSCRFSDS